MSASNASLIIAMLNAPLIGVGPNRRVLHAVPMEHVPGAYETGSATAACGSVGLKLMPMGEYPDSPAPWPPDTRGLPTTLHRCGECMKAAQPKRPRVRLERRDLLGRDVFEEAR